MATMVHDDDEADGRAAVTMTAIGSSCRLCCKPSVDADEQNPIIGTASAAAAGDDNDGTRPGLRDTIVKHLRIQVSDQPFTVI